MSLNLIYYFKFSESPECSVLLRSPSLFFPLSSNNTALFSQRGAQSGWRGVRRCGCFSVLWCWRVLDICLEPSRHKHNKNTSTPMLQCWTAPYRAPPSRPPPPLCGCPSLMLPLLPSPHVWCPSFLLFVNSSRENTSLTVQFTNYWFKIIINTWWFLCCTRNDSID